MIRSVGGSVSRSVGRSVCWLAGLLVRIIIFILRVFIDTMTRKCFTLNTKTFRHIVAVNFGYARSRAII